MQELHAVTTAATPSSSSAQHSSVVDTRMRAKIRIFANQLYYIFVMTAKEKALQKTKSVQDTNWREARRRFHRGWELTQQGRFTAMLRGILKQDFIGPPLQSIEACERAVLTYDQQSKEIIPEVILTEEVCSTTVPMGIGEVYAKKGNKGKKG